MYSAATRSGSGRLLLFLVAFVLFCPHITGYPIYLSQNGTVRLETLKGGDLLLEPGFGGTVVARSLLSAQVRSALFALCQLERS